MSTFFERTIDGNEIDTVGGQEFEMRSFPREFGGDLRKDEAVTSQSVNMLQHLLTVIKLLPRQIQ